MTQSNDLLARVRAAVALARDRELEIKSLEERLGELKASQDTLLKNDIPDLMAEAGISKIKLDSDGNAPSVTATMKPFVFASISKQWPEDQRQAAYDWLDEHGAGDLIKTEIGVSLGKDDRAEALELVSKIRALGYEPSIDASVHHATLSKWLREAIQRGMVVPLGTIGGEVGRKVHLKEEED